MTIKLGFTSEITFNLNHNPEVVKKRIKNLDLETNIIRTSFEKRQIGLLAKGLHFIDKNDIEIIKKGDILDPFKSGRGKIIVRISEKEGGRSELKCYLRSQFQELLMSLFGIGIIVLTVIYGNSESKYCIALGMFGLLVLITILKYIHLRLNLKYLKKELIELIKLIE